MEEKKIKTGIVGIIGKTNSGKSTLINQLTGYKISIVSEKPQTTRFNIKGVLNIKDEAQIIFIDTPGILKPHNELGKMMLNEIKEITPDVDLILYLVAADELIKEENNELLFSENLMDYKVFLVINKIDRITKEELLTLIDKYKDVKWIKEIIPISARKGININELKKTIIKELDYGEKFYDDNCIDDLSDNMYIAEIIREKAINLTYQEVPYSIAVEVIDVHKTEKKVLYISAVIYVEKESHKGIVIGKKGNLIKQIGTLAREELEETLEEKIYLDLTVRVKKDWRKDIHFIKSIYKKLDDEE
ncbi:MAG TPA: GTPase Era [bacterium]|nr:GTPase Era [bacterium]HOL48535.1 GTPase Era [bacterium]HPQ19987.1 GTPase Era [bacterium]